jgi:hypothetical protein
VNYFNCPFCDVNIAYSICSSENENHESEWWIVYACDHCKVYLTRHYPSGRIDEIQFNEKDVHCTLDIGLNRFLLINVHGPIKLYSQGKYPPGLTLPQLRQKFLDKISLYVLFS